MAPCALLLMAAATDPTGGSTHEKDYVDYIPNSYLPTREVAVIPPSRANSVGTTTPSPRPAYYLLNPDSGNAFGQERGIVRLPFVAALLLCDLLGGIVALMFCPGEEAEVIPSSRARHGTLHRMCHSGHGFERSKPGSTSRPKGLVPHNRRRPYSWDYKVWHET